MSCIGSSRVKQASTEGKASQPSEGKDLSLGNLSSSRDGNDPGTLDHVQLQQKQVLLQHLPHLETHISPMRFVDVRL